MLGQNRERLPACILRIGVAAIPAGIHASISLAGLAPAIDPHPCAPYTAALSERVAQMVEHVTFNHGVLGSIPSALTNKIKCLQRNCRKYSQVLCLRCVCKSIADGMALGAPLSWCCIKASTRIEIRSVRNESLTVQAHSRPLCAGASDRWCNMREEFASYSFLALTVAGVVMLFSGLVAFAIA
jgi:hypothetical protein